MALWVKKKMGKFEIYLKKQVKLVWNIIFDKYILKEKIKNLKNPIFFLHRKNQFKVKQKFRAIQTKQFQNSVEGKIKSNLAMHEIIVSDIVKHAL